MGGLASAARRRPGGGSRHQYGRNPNGLGSLGKLGLCDALEIEFGGTVPDFALLLVECAELQRVPWQITTADH